MSAMILARQDASVESRGAGLISVCVIFSVLIIAFVALRTVRTIKTRRFAVEDVLIFLATLLALSNNALLIASTSYGEGKHIQDISDSDIYQALTLPWITEPLSAFTLLFSKASVGAVLYQLGLGKTFKILIIVVIIISTVVNAWAAIAIVTGCHPDKSVSNGAAHPCSPSGTAAIGTYVQSAINMLLDLSIVILPEIFLRSVRLGSRDRRILRVLLGFMLFATIASAVKTALLPALFASSDVTWDSAPVSDCSAIENAFSILAACLPGIHSLLSPWLYKHRNSQYNSQSSSAQVHTSSPQSATPNHKSHTSYSAHPTNSPYPSNDQTVSTTHNLQSPNTILTPASSSRWSKSPRSSVKRYGPEDYDLNPDFDNDEESRTYYDDRIHLVGMNRPR